MSNGIFLDGIAAIVKMKERQNEYRRKGEKEKQRNSTNLKARIS